MNKKVGIEACSSYESAFVYEALKRAVELAGDFDVREKTVLLKPNILSDVSPEKAVSTHPVFLEAVIALVREGGAGRILVGDSPGIQLPGFSARGSGIGEAAKRNGAEWVDFTKEKIEIPCPEGKVMKKFTVTAAVREADIVISLPKLKTHQFMNFTGAMKNIFGLVPSLLKSPFHARFPNCESFAAMLVDLNLAVKPAYALMDAITGMEGPGPSAGKPRHIGLVLASSNLLAMDVAASTIIAYPPGEIPLNREALGRGYWLSDPGEIEYPGLAPADVRIPDYVKVPIKRPGSPFIDFLLPGPVKRLKETHAAGPEINHGVCVRCGDCMRICGSRAISMENKKGDSKNKPRMIIDYSRCIRCFCCHEICPAKAIEVKNRPRNQ